jgi:single-strand DNA-binding protein
MGMNVITLMGRLCTDVELRNTSGGKVVGKARIAAKDWKKTVFTDLTLWGPRAEAFAKYHSKGDMVCVSGRLSMDEWESDGKKRSKLYVTVNEWSFTGSKGESPGEEPPF